MDTVRTQSIDGGVVMVDTKATDSFRCLGKTRGAIDLSTSLADNMIVMVFSQFIGDFIACECLLTEDRTPLQLIECTIDCGLIDSMASGRERSEDIESTQGMLCVEDLNNRLTGLGCSSHTRLLYASREWWQCGILF